LKICKITALHYRQIRGDMIEVYEIVSEKYDSAITPTLIISDKQNCRGNDLRLITTPEYEYALNMNLHNFYFSSRVVDQ